LLLSLLLLLALPVEKERAWKGGYVGRACMWAKEEEDGKVGWFANDAKGAVDFCPRFCGPQGTLRRRHLCVCWVCGGRGVGGKKGV